MDTTNNNAKPLSLSEMVKGPEELRHIVYKYWRDNFPILAFSDSDDSRWVVPVYDEVIGYTLYMTGNFSKDEMDAFFRLADEYKRESPNYIEGTRQDFCDIGANIGTTSIYAAKQHGVDYVYAFEPLHENYSLLRANIALNHMEKKIYTVCTAIGEKAGKSRLGKCYRNSGDHRILHKKEVYDDNIAEVGARIKREEEVVRTMSLDYLFSNSKHNIGYFWIDTQGYEYYVLKGAQKTIAACDHPAIVVEFWPFGLKETDSLEKMCDYINEHFLGYIDTSEYLATGSKFVHPTTDIYDLADKLNFTYDPINLPDKRDHTNLFLISKAEEAVTALLPESVPQSSKIGAEANFGRISLSEDREILYDYLQDMMERLNSMTGDLANFPTVIHDSLNYRMHEKAHAVNTHLSELLAEHTRKQEIFLSKLASDHCNTVDEALQIFKNKVEGMDARLGEMQSAHSMVQEKVIQMETSIVTLSRDISMGMSSMNESFRSFDNILINLVSNVDRMIFAVTHPLKWMWRKIFKNPGL